MSLGCLAAVAVANPEASAPAATPTQLVDELAAATAAGSWDEAAAIAANLGACGDQAPPAISAGLSQGDEDLTRMLLRSLWAIRTESSTSLMVSLIPSASQKLVGEVVGRLENRVVSRPPTELEYNTLTKLILAADLYSPLMAGAAARVLGNCIEVPAEQRAAPILKRFVAEIPRVQPGDEAPLERFSYLPPRVFRLNRFLLAFSCIGPDAIPVISQARHERAANPEVYKWLTLALGRASDRAVAAELEQMVREETDMGTRIEAIRSYSRSAGEAAIPLLLSLLDDDTVTKPSGCIRTGDPQTDKEYPIRMAAGDELSRLGRQDLVF